MSALFKLMGVVALAMTLQACLVTKIVTVPVKVAYGTTKAVVKGTAAVVGAAIPDDDDDDKQPSQAPENK